MIRLTAKEIGRASNDGWTIVRRRQPDGTFWVVAVHVETGQPHLNGEHATTKEDVAAAVQRANRWLSKVGSGGNMSDRSRFRRLEKETT